MRIDGRGRVTIPRDVRKRHGLLPGVEVRFVDDGSSVRLEPAEREGPIDRTPVDPVRRRATTQLTIDDVVA